MPSNNYLEDQELLQMRFDIDFFSSGLITPFDFRHGEMDVTCGQVGSHFRMSFVMDLPKSLVDDLSWGRNGAEAYVMGYMFFPLQKLNLQILDQKYSKGHFMLKTFSVFDISSILISNTHPEWQDQVIRVPWPLILPPPPHEHFVTTGSQTLEVFIRDYVDAGTDLLRGEHDQCVRRLITSVENALFYFGFRSGTFMEKVKTALPQSENHLGQGNVLKNIEFLYKVRNKITHDKLRISPSNGWWLSVKAMKTVQYFCQFADPDRSERGSGAYAFRTWAFVEQILQMTKGRTLLHDQQVADSIAEAQAGNGPIPIDNDDDFDEYMYGIMLITDNEKECILQNRLRDTE